MPDHTRRFGLVMPYLARFEGVPEGVLIENSFWCVDEDHTHRYKSVILYWYRGWESVEKYNQGFPPIPGAERVYQLDGPLYDEAVMRGTTHPIGTPIGLEVTELMNAHAIATKDVHVEGGEPISFFENAQPAL